MLACEEFQRLEDIYRIVKNIEFDFIKPEQSFAIRANRVGEHEFTSIDIARVAGQAVIDSYMESKGIRLGVNLDEPDIIIRVDVIQNEIYVGLDTTGDDALHKRWYRVYQHPAPLNTAIASAMLKLAKWNENKVLFDPMCGGGTIPIEAALMGRNIPIGKKREFAYFKIFGKEFPEIEEKENHIEIYGMEKFLKHILGAIENAKEAGVNDTIKFFRGDATNINIDVGIDIVVTNPPYGLRIGSKRIIEDLYNGFLNSLRNVLNENATIVVITSEYEILKEKALLYGYKIQEEIKVRYGNLDTIIFKMSQ